MGLYYVRTKKPEPVPHYNCYCTLEILLHMFCEMAHHRAKPVCIYEGTPSNKTTNADCYPITYFARCRFAADAGFVSEGWAGRLAPGVFLPLAGAGVVLLLLLPLPCAGVVAAAALAGVAWASVAAAALPFFPLFFSSAAPCI